ncbi:Amidase signature domain [Trinorchestia longiramus]|nr:Amidase signature domain [Trinorchestia longiramus]
MSLEALSWIIFSILYRSSPGKILPPIRNLLLLESATSLSAKIRDRKVTSREVVAAFIERIKEINPILNCVVETRFDEALKEAEAIDSELSNTSKDKDTLKRETPFLGVPFSMKECVQVKGFRQTSGLYARRNFVAEEDADVVRLLRQAGGILLCTTNVPELCMWWETDNYVYGRSNNPYNTNCITGGSSGGEACVQAACGAPMGVGSDIGGSIRMPAFFNGIFGHKGSMGIVSCEGQVPMATGNLLKMLSTGPMCKHAADLRPMLRVLAANNAPLLDIDTKVRLQDMRVFYIEDDGGSCFTTPVQGELRAAMRAVVSHLHLGHKVTAKKLELKELRNVYPMYMAMMGEEKEAPKFSEQLANGKGSVSVWWETLKLLVGQTKHTVPALLLATLEASNNNDAAVAIQLQRAAALREKLKEILGNDGVLLYPSHPTVAPYHHQPLFRSLNFVYTALFNITYLPVTQCPLGLSKAGLPMGLQIVANNRKDHLCLSVAEELEKAFGGWVCPSVVE